MKHQYEVGDVVWVAPKNWCDVKGVVVSFQKISPYLPVVELKLKVGSKIHITHSVFDWDRISPYRKGRVRK